MATDIPANKTIRCRGTKPGRRVHKQYVDVFARTNADGSIVPIRACWPDGRCFTIDEIVKTIPFGPIIHDTQTATYTCRFARWKTDIYLEHYHKEDPIHGAEDHLRWWVWAFDNTWSRTISTPPRRDMGPLSVYVSNKGDVQNQRGVENKN